IFVYFGDGTSSGHSEGIALKNGQHLIGHHAGLSLDVDLNDNGSPTHLVAAAPGSRPVLDDTVAGGPEGISAVDVVPATIVGLRLAGNVNAINWTTTPGFAGGGSFTIRNNIIRGAANEGVDITLAGTGALNLAFHDNALAASGPALDLQRTGTGTLTITAFDDNQVGGESGSGLVVSGARFDAVPGGGVDLVSGGATVIGAPADSVGGAGLVLGGVTGGLSFADLDVFAGGGAALQASSGAGGFQLAVNPAVAILEATGGPAVDVSNAAINLPLSSLKSTSSVTTGVSLATVTGSLSAGAGSSITSNTGRAFQVDGSNATVSYAGTINNNGTGVSLTNNTGSTLSFTGTMTLSTGANAAFTATGGGTVSATSTASTLATTTGTALHVNNAFIGASGLTFRSISSNGAASGIVLNTTGSSGGLTVSGTGGAGSGGTIQNASGPGIHLISTGSVNLASINVQNGGDDGIRGSNVTGFALANSTISANGNAVGEHGLEFTNLLGTANITGSTVTGSAEDNLRVDNASGTLTMLTVGGAGCTFSNSSAAFGNDGIHFRGTGTAVMSLAVSGCNFTNHRGDHFQATTDAAGLPVMDVDFIGNTLVGAAGNLGASITINPSGSAKLTFDVKNNSIVGAASSAMTLNLGTSSTASAELKGTVSGNTIGNAAVLDSGSGTGDGINVAQNGAGTLTALVSGNTIRQYSNLHGIHLVARDGNGKLNATVVGNTVSNPGSFASNAFMLNAGPVSTDTHQVCLVLGGPGAQANSFAGAGANGSTDFRVRQRASTTVTLPGYAGSNIDTAAVVTFIQGNNTGAPSGSATVNSPPGGGFVNGAACPLP
ncbi:MAG TPA: hypothetical protein VEG34_01325, partial [Thermoanaerobaculia bacterium]|nr:hypothetical protein [Thermoanaerobaculia bacterium]